MLVPLTSHQKNALMICAVAMLVLGAAVMVAGFTVQFNGMYDEITDTKPVNIHHLMFPHIQYWLGLPYFLLAFFVFTTRFYPFTVLHIIGLILCGFGMIASLCALGLQSATWYIALDLANTVNTVQCWNVNTHDHYSSSQRCNCKRELHFKDSSSMEEHESLLSLLTCSEVRHLPAMVSALVVLSALSFLVGLATCFVYFKILHWLEPIQCGEESHPSNRHVLLNEQSM